VRLFVLLNGMQRAMRGSKWVAMIAEMAIL
jgi:hypothetical protein